MGLGRFNKWVCEKLFRMGKTKGLIARLGEEDLPRSGLVHQLLYELPFFDPLDLI